MYRKAANGLLAGLIVILISLSFAAPALAAVQAWESYTTGDDSGANVYGVNWYGQTFTVDPESHSVVDIRFLGYRVGTPSTVTVSIREVDGTGMPVGADLTSGTIDGDAMTTDTAGSWYGVTLTELSLEYDEEYAICFRAEAGDSSNYMVIREDSTGAYADGQAVSSTSGGIAWAGVTGEDIMFQVDGNGLLDVLGAKVFNGYLEDDDMFIVISYLNTYVPYYPDEVVTLEFNLQLRSTNGSVVLAQTVCRQWGYMPGCIYLNANQAASLTVGLPYRVYLTGTSSPQPGAYYALTSTDWQGDALNLLDGWVITMAHSMATYYDVTLTTQIQNAEVLNSEGGALFATGIPSLIATDPHLFQDAAYTPDLNPITPGGTEFDTATTWQDQVGPTAAQFANLVGGIIDVDGRYAIAGGIFIIYLVICGVVVKSKGDPVIGSLLCVPMLLGAGWLRVIDFQLIACIGAVAVIMTVYRFHWSRT